MRVLRKMSSWNSADPDNVLGYWLKNLSPVHDRFLVHFQDCLDCGVVSDWLTIGRTVFIQKDKTRGNIASNYRPITSLPLVPKLLKGKSMTILKRKCYFQRKKKDSDQSVEETGVKGIGDLWLVDKMLFWEVLMREEKPNSCME